jgi:Flp pilus assembly protein TadB
MSKSRQLARAERERAAAERTAARRAEHARAAAVRARQQRRALTWRRLRIWQHGPGFRRNRDKWGALGALVLVALVGVFVITRSIGAVLGTALVLIVGAPVLVLLFFDRSRK